MLGNTQVVLVGLIAWALFRERPAAAALAAIPWRCSGSSESQAWLVVLALTPQVLGWLLITVSLPRLPAVITSLLLTLQPVAAVVFAAILIDEEPSPLQLVGAVAILAGLMVATVGRRARTPDSVPEQA